jgi:hypothetical protein
MFDNGVAAPARPRLTVGEEGEHRRRLIFDEWRQHDDLPCAAGRSVKPRFVAPTSASARSSSRSRPTSTRNRARCDSPACFAGTPARAALLDLTRILNDSFGDPYVLMEESGAEPQAQLPIG